MNYSIKFELNRRTETLIVILSSMVTSLYTFALSLKRYNNFEFGKFDLGNMSQLVWNTSRGHFMEITDQFGTNMPRWGMSHVDPILIIFTPIYYIYNNPMLLVFVQNVTIVSAAYPLYFIYKKYTSHKIGALGVAILYLLYPAVGYILVWTGFHGITLAAPLFIWTVYLLEQNNFLIKKHSSKRYKKALFIYWVLTFLMLSGKEEIGAILTIASLFLFFKNKNLALLTAIVSFSWFVISFFVIIPGYSNARLESIESFVKETNAQNIKPELASQENFFFVRYGHLGSSYPEMLKTSVIHPEIIVRSITEDYKLKTIEYLFGPLGFIALISPLWLISLPDIAITMLSEEKIFEISNHRIGFVITTIFLSYIYTHIYIFNKLKNKNIRYLDNIFTTFVILCLMLTTYYNIQSKNPVFVSGLNFIQEKILKNHFAIAREYENTSNKKPGELSWSTVPRNNNKCLNKMVELLYTYNPETYSGPDYLGAHSSNRYINALFPARASDVNLVIADLFETKTIAPLGGGNSWTFNKKIIQDMIERNNYRHVYSCGKLQMFTKGKNQDQVKFIRDISNKKFRFNFDLESKKVRMKVLDFYSPQNFHNTENKIFKITLQKLSSGFEDHVTFWKLVGTNNNKTYSFIDYLTIGTSNNLDSIPTGSAIELTREIDFLNELQPDTYKIYYGVGTLSQAKDIYLGNITF